MRVFRSKILGGCFIAAGFWSSISFAQRTDLPKQFSARLEPNPNQETPTGRVSVWMVKHQLATKIRGRSVENRDGQYLGQVEDFILDSKSGKVRFLVISFRGWFGLGKKLKAVATQIVSTATAKLGVVGVDTGWRRWERAPVFEKTDLLRLSQD